MIMTKVKVHGGGGNNNTEIYLKCKRLDNLACGMSPWVIDFCCVQSLKFVDILSFFSVAKYFVLRGNRQYCPSRRYSLSRCQTRRCLRVVILNTGISCVASIGLWFTPHALRTKTNNCSGFIKGRPWQSCLQERDGLGFWGRRRRCRRNSWPRRPLRWSPEEAASE